MPSSTSKSKALAALKTKKGSIGAPAQHSQSSRKGKKAWRKNVNIEEVEEALEEGRAEERVTGTKLKEMQNDQLFQIDTQGDAQVRTAMPRFSTSQLTSTKILAQRSAVPAVFSRATGESSNKRKSLVTREEKERLLRIAKRPRKGPFNAVMDPSEYAAGSGTVDLSEAVKQSGTYDAWAAEPEVEIKDGLETVFKPKPKAPVLSKTKDLIDVKAIAEPHQGTSYNPPVDAHQELIEKAAEAEKRRLEKEERLAEVKRKIDGARAANSAIPVDVTVANGMIVQEVRDDDEEDDEEPEEARKISKKVAERKTKAQKNRAARVLKEKRALAERAGRKKLYAAINDAKSIRRSNAKTLSQQEEQRLERLAKLAEKLKTQGLAGTKLGKHKVPQDNVVVQLGEDLTENLRGLKPEGNLFRDRFQSLQQRALVEPRVPVVPSKRKHRMVEYEKHAWKNFSLPRADSNGLITRRDEIS